MKHKNIGERFDSFLKKENIYDQVERVAIKRAFGNLVQLIVNIGKMVGGGDFCIGKKVKPVTTPELVDK